MATHQRHTQPRGVRLPHALRGGVQELLDRLARALVAGDGERVAARWETPALVIDDSAAIAVSEPAEIARYFGGVRAQYNARGTTGTRDDILDLERVLTARRRSTVRR